MSQDQQDAAEHIEELLGRMSALSQKCCIRSEMRLAREMQRVAKTERLVVPYLRALFSLTNGAQSTDEADLGVEWAIEAIALLESEERARQFQSNLPEQEYYRTVYWMSACAYDNLATHAANRDGYNSDGVHQTINDGIHVCRRTGKLECVNCFREYAARVCLAAGDLAMAAHHAKTVATAIPRDAAHDRRFCGAYDLAQLALFDGRPADALEALSEAFRFSATYHTPTFALLRTAGQLEQTLLVSGRHGELDALLARGLGGRHLPEAPPEGEDTQLDLHRSNCRTLSACCAGDYEQAIDALRQWDRRMQTLNNVDRWFDVRLRLIAACRLAGKTGHVEALARQLEARAKTARDWFTLARLKRLLSDDAPSPLALLKPLREGPFAPAAIAPAAKADPPAVNGQAAQEVAVGPAADADPATPLAPMLDGLSARVRGAATQDEQFGQLLDETMSTRADQVEDARDAGRLVNLAGYLVGQTGRGAEAWAWAVPFAEKFSQDAATLNVVAALGDTARRTAGDRADQIVGMERLELLFAASLELDCEGRTNFARAGSFYRSAAKPAEAQRCFARAFQLDRTDAFVAWNLAQIYTESERPRDALAVLEMCVRDGCRDPGVLWEAGTTALRLDRHELALQFFNMLEEARPEQPWTQYYRAWALLAVGRPQEAFEAAEREQQCCAKPVLHAQILQACALADLKDADRFSRRLAEVLAVRLAAVDYLTTSGLARLYTRLYEASKSLPEDGPLRADFRSLLLKSALAPNQLFDDDREAGEKQPGINYYVCRIEQPLDKAWPAWPGCLAGQDRWTSYRAAWGVLARDEAEARRFALAAQTQCYPREPGIVECRLEGEGYTDRPGVVWQGMREAVAVE